MPQVEINNDEVLVNLVGSIYVQEATVIREKLMKYCEEEYKRMIINMTNVDYIDSSGLGVLVAIQKRVNQTEGQLIIKGLTGKVKELFELTKLSSVFQIIE